MDSYYNAPLVLSLKILGEFYNAPKQTSPVKAWVALYCNKISD